ncbi:transposase [Klebsiella pneumoniae]|uniref:transposase n=1 Tax=Klebsiella pneumoniae TaxID=573 RepID=UPI00194034C5|nr:transposase [Klebsiella pneumoniae]MBM5770667.1 hypothetical protein [Klebsiella pneumoniae]
MSHQLTFADSEFSTKRRQTRKEIFLSRMEQILPWQNMVEVIEPFYPKAGNGRRPYPLETMLRIHCMQHWYNLSDGAMEHEHPFRIIKRQFGFVKARYKGLLKNDNQLAMLFTLANLFRVDQMIRQWERSQ